MMMMMMMMMMMRIIFNFYRTGNFWTCQNRPHLEEDVHGTESDLFCCIPFRSLPTSKYSGCSVLYRSKGQQVKPRVTLYIFSSAENG